LAKTDNVSAAHPATTLKTNCRDRGSDIVRVSLSYLEQQIYDAVYERRWRRVYSTVMADEHA
jgi:hypothetical protein